MSKKQQKGGKTQPKEKSLAEQKKEILAKNYGSKQSKEVKNLLKKMEIQEKLKRKEIEEKKLKEQENQLRIVENKPKKPVQTIQQEQIELTKPSDMVCRFLIDALQNKTFKKDWKCPLNCSDIHEITNSNLEEFLEMKRVSVATDKMLDKEEYDKFIIKLEGEKKKFKAALTGYDLYKKGLLKDIEDIETISENLQ
ncbi:hypothetical protein M153_5516000295 [Pseudoloma neurophilia]|uniref:Uncharacterized protein n=1 Tax=Pseudoloma neurophilia TaxID=146866 RepID=A0A0R0LSQ9_9MICR|nr:hypothetical protein M153_5516000295 [Pseudoloma neurophilia]